MPQLPSSNLPRALIRLLQGAQIRPRVTTWHWQMRRGLRARPWKPVRQGDSAEIAFASFRSGDERREHQTARTAIRRL
jgi:hypothetical protein